jgi:Uma2 family endonuclease
MGLPKLRPKISVADYLEGEKHSQVRHEYLDGEVYAMAGTSRRHNEIIGNLIEKLRRHLRGDTCRPYFVDIKVRIERLNRFYYPDIIIICGEEDQYFVDKPKLIIEILSPSTALTDRREKMFAYKEIESLEEYILIEQDKMYAEVYRRRRDSGLWDWIEFFPDEEIEFASIDFKMPMSEIYAGVELPEKSPFE